MQSYEPHIAAEREGAATAESFAVVALCNSHHQGAESATECRPSGVASNLIEFGRMGRVHEAVNLSPARAQPAVLDCCDQRLICRVAKKLGCRFCAE